MIKETYRKNLIVSADDFGISSLANENILKLLRQKKIDRIAILVDGTFSNDQIAELLNSKVKLDIHLETLLKPRNKRKTKESVLLRSFLFAYKYLRREISSSSIEQDWTAQLEKFKKLFNRLPDGINSHQHIHFFPPFFRVILKLKEKNHIPYLRFGKKGFIKNSSSAYHILNFFRNKNQAIFDANKCTSSDYLISLSWIKNLDIFTKKLSTGKTELICHPEIPEEYAFMEKNF